MDVSEARTTGLGSLVPVPPRDPGEAPQRIEVEVGELVLDGFPRVDGDRVAAAFRRELVRLLETGRGYARDAPVAAAADRSVDVLAGLPPLPATTSSRRLGRALAQAVHTGLVGVRDP